MLSLESLQRRIAAAIPGNDDADLLAVIEPGGIAPAARLQIYCNHAFLTLIEALEGDIPRGLPPRRRTLLLLCGA